MTRLVTLTKINILEEAQYPQKEKYPDGMEVQGYMYQFSKPKVGERYTLLKSKVWPIFVTSEVTEVIKDTLGEIVFKTLNSTYKITWDESSY